MVAGGGLTVRHAVLLNDLLAESASREAFAVDPSGLSRSGARVHRRDHLRAERSGTRRDVAQARWQTLRPDAKEWLAATAFLMKVRQRLVDRQYQRPGFGVLGKRNAARSNRSAAPRVNSATKGRSFASGSAPPSPSLSAPAGNSQRPAPMIRLVAPGRPDTGRPNLSVFWRLPYDPTVAMRSDLAPPPLATLGGLYQTLMPRDVQMVPLGLIGAVLAAYVVAIGPIDYFLLGLLRMRRLTWILFPLVTIGFAGSTLWLSRWYLGTNDSRRALEIYDVVKGGTVARRTRVELLFLSRRAQPGDGGPKRYFFTGRSRHDGRHAPVRRGRPRRPRPPRLRSVVLCRPLSQPLSGRAAGSAMDADRQSVLLDRSQAGEIRTVAPGPIPRRVSIGTTRAIRRRRSAVQPSQNGFGGPSATRRAPSSTASTARPWLFPFSTRSEPCAIFHRFRSRLRLNGASTTSWPSCRSARRKNSSR